MQNGEGYCKFKKLSSTIRMNSCYSEAFGIIIHAI
uniref:Uncharacterized protein n=1 Tax=Rhizophora mucronata TaxID=61149 RepID=A0A2P2QEQ7_RHIMU